MEIIDRIIEKAHRAGIYTGTGNKNEQIKNIASHFGIFVSDGNYNLDRIENALDNLLRIQFGENENDAFNRMANSDDDTLDNGTNYTNAVNRQERETKSDEAKEDADKKDENEENNDENSNGDENKDKENDNDDGENETPNNSHNKRDINKRSENRNLGRERSQNRVNAGSEKLANMNKNRAGANPVEAASKIGASGASAVEAAKKSEGVVKGTQALLALLKNPMTWYVLGGVLLVIVFVLLLMLFFTTANNYSNGYFDSVCNFNNTRVNYSCDDVSGNATIKDFVIASTYAYTKDYSLSSGAIQALMIAIKTSALSNGYSNSNKNVTVGCSIEYESLSSGDSNYKKLEEEYKKIERYLYLSSSYDNGIESISSSSFLNITNNIEKFATATGGNYSAILNSVYGTNRTSTNNNEENESENENENANAVRGNLFIGDSRTVQMEAAVSEMDSTNTVALGSKGYDWFSSTAVSNITSILNNNSDKSFNIISWMGVNDLGETETYGVNAANKYFAKYKELAEGSWSKHIIYVVSVGPVVDSSTYYVDMPAVNAFNNTIKDLINSAGISNLRYIDLGLDVSDITYYDAEGVHYDTANYQKIYNLIIDSIGTGGVGAYGDLKIYDLGKHCEWHKNKGNGCEAGWWYPIGVNGDFKKGDILSEVPGNELLDWGEDNFGWRNDPFTGERKWHDGSDLLAAFGRNVIASRSGTVIDAKDGFLDYGGTKTGYGNYVIIDHGDGTFTRYGHLQNGSVDKYVTVGMSVAQGQIIGLSGNSGRSTGPHLHFEIRQNNMWGQVLNPFDYISLENPRPKGACNIKDNYSADKTGICQALKDLGFSDNAVAGLMANIYSEGGFTPTTVVPNDNGGPSIGMIGWHDEFICETVDVCEVSTKLPSNTCNASGLKCYCRQNNLDWDTVACQISYIKHYIDIHANTPDFDAAKTIYNPSSSAQEIATDFCLKLERPANKYSNCPTRNASPMLEFVKNGCA